MLKLEKNKHQLTVIIRDKERLYTRTFLKAFFLAASIHILLLTLFHVTPFKLPFGETTYPPVQVDADTFLKNTLASANMDYTPKINSNLPPMPTPLPKMPEHPLFLAWQHMEYLKESKSSGNPFSQIEKEIYHPNYTPIAKAQQSPINMIVSGNLGGRPLIENGLDREKISAIKSISMGEEKRAIFSVLVEGHSGKIFWQESKQLTSIAALDRLSENILRDCLFDKDPQAFVIEGEIELHFRGSIE